MFVEAFLVFDQKFSKRQKHTKLSSDRHILLFGSVRCLHYVCLFLFDHPVDVNEGTISFRVRLVSPCCDRRKTSPRSRGERGGKIILFLRAKKRKLLLPSSSVVVSCDLFFFITTMNYIRAGSLGFFSFSFVLLLPSRGSNRRVVVVGRSRLLLLFLLLSFTHTRSLSSLLKNRHLLEASIDHFSKQKTHNLFSYIF